MYSPSVPGKGSPRTNYATLRTNADSPATQDVLVIPRSKYTFAVDLQLNPELENFNFLHPNFLSNFKDGRITIPLISIDVPQPSFSTTILNSYNRKYPVQTKEDLGQGKMIFYNDTASLVEALWMEYRNFKHSSADRNTNDRVFSNGLLRSSGGSNATRGMKLMPVKDPFFIEFIRIYDFGGVDDSINVDTFIQPTFTSFSKGPLSYNERTAMQGATISFNYSDHVTEIGKNSGDFVEIVNKYMWANPKQGNAKTGHIQPR